MTKTSVQLAPGPGQSMFSMEQDYTGADFTASVKAMNPSILEGGLTGIFIGDYLQSITPRLALGLNAMWQRAAMNTGPDTLVSYAARYKGDDWIASGQLVAAGGLQLSYWRRIAEKVEGGVDVNLQVAPGAGAGMMGGPLKKEGTTTIGAKYNFRQSSFRAQLDSQGRLGVLFEKHIAPAVSVTFSGEIDHVKVRAMLQKFYASCRSNYFRRARLRSALPSLSKTHRKRSWSNKNRLPICNHHHFECLYSYITPISHQLHFFLLYYHRNSPQRLAVERAHDDSNRCPIDTQYFTMAR